MDLSWSQPRMTPPHLQAPQLQLEREYEIDPAQFQVLQPDIIGQRFDIHIDTAGRQAIPRLSSYDAGFPTYVHSTQTMGGGQLGFSRTPQHIASQSAHMPINGGVTYPVANGSSQLQRSPQEPFTTPSHFYHSRNSSLQPSSSSSPQQFLGESVQNQAFQFGAHSHSHPQAQAGSGSQHPSPRVSPTIGGFQQQINAPQQLYTPLTSPGVPITSLQGSPAASAYPDHAYSQILGHGAFKRLRPDDDDGHDGEGFDLEGDGLCDDGQPDGRGDEQVDRPKPGGACGRCKGLKVKCEFIGDVDRCQRCAKGGYNCVIPNRKKRRPPPKREHLLNQIRDQTAQIAELMRQLEDANRRANKGMSGGTTPLSSSRNRGDSTTLMPSDIGETAPPPTLSMDVDVEDWIAKARQSIDAFGGYIKMGGPSVTTDMLGDEGNEGDEESDADYQLNIEEVDDDEGDESCEADGGDGDSLFGEEDSAGAGRERVSGMFSRESTEGASALNGTRVGGSVMQKLATLPSEAAAFGLMANLSLTKSKRWRAGRTRSENSEEDVDVGLANDDYFRPSPAPERPIVDELRQPAILKNGIIKPAEAEQLFKIYYDYMNLSLSLLDPVLYTAQKTYWRSPLLFTVICAIASRHYAPRPELYQQAMKYARLAAGTALIGGQKTIEVVQAYILLSLYPVPARRWEEDRSFIYLGLAIRVATDLKLHYAINTPKAENEMHAREMLNRTRVWLNCFNLDRSTGSQYGQRPIINNADYVANHTEDWWKCSPYNLPGFDVHTCCYNAELKILGAFRARIYSNPNHPTGLNKEVDLAKEAINTDDRLAHLWETWRPRVYATNADDPQAPFRTGLLKLAFSYARLSVLSVGFQHSFGKAAPTDEVPFLWRCLRAAEDTVKAVVDEIAIPEHKIYLRHGPEAQSVFVTFASAFLVKLLQPKYTNYLSRDKRIEIRNLVQRVIDLLGSPKVAIDDRHGPKLYARFLHGLLSTPIARIDHSPASLRRDGVSRRSTKHSSASSGTSSARQSLSPPPPVSNTSSPKAFTPHTPPPTVTHAPFDHLNHSPPATVSGSPQLQMQSNLEAPGFFSPPLFYDAELIQSMQSISDWPDMVLPGFNWMGSLPSNSSNNMTYDLPVAGFTGSA
ncbi:uncharacterized protein LAESUDRAFT_764298 [Laetiporus sulphureus 93-53]|uniref:Zn(2)-C6 fungal-type domain-containing protein n=1 Tax=Laetiporus sulphureus 93-53 TaxID=1314785 RepID=A0A165BCV5_9APHY|nr:uncharacterized protein LAESUDRAFT_764298 [Laetiporus sulphureus 93-53]KZT00764.1 hypothetical protein LAESUDRAFT_764298 [Laetiporus sulphureus 93-53]